MHLSDAWAFREAAMFLIAGGSPRLRGSIEANLGAGHERCATSA
jgi:hypothetical protein